MFDKKLFEVSPHTKLCLSSPLLNGKSQHKEKIMILRRSLIFYLHEHEKYSDFVQARLLVQQNHHLMLDSNTNMSRQNARYFLEQDPLHLSDRGKMCMITTMRDTLHVVLQEQEQL